MLDRLENEDLVTMTLIDRLAGSTLTCSASSSASSG
jgi:hypothetical protein